VLEAYGLKESPPFRDLAPSILRQRLVIEGTRARPINAQEISDYLVAISHVTDMTVLIDPVTHRSDMYGWAGWVHWETSGAHFYAWEHPFVFFSVDIYTCKAFDAQRAVEFTRKYFDADEVVSKEF
jgi:S-adenosylmethionine decarboxylase